MKNSDDFISLGIRVPIWQNELLKQMSAKGFRSKAKIIEQLIFDLCTKEKAAQQTAVDTNGIRT